jgi:exonuclease V gamma subunit
MGNNKRLKPGKNEIIRRTNVLLQEVQTLKHWFDYCHNLITEFIVFEGKEDKFKKYLKEKIDADNEKSRQLQKSTSTNNSTEGGKQKAKKKTARKTKKKLRDTTETGRIGV